LGGGVSCAFEGGFESVHLGFLRFPTKLLDSLLMLFISVGLHEIALFPFLSPVHICFTASRMCTGKMAGVVCVGQVPAESTQIHVGTRGSASGCSAHIDSLLN
jgi:hypothetical protein